MVDVRRFVTVTSGLRGFYAVLVGVNSLGFSEPIQTGVGSYGTFEEAIPEAKSWATEEGVEFELGDGGN